ncbi:hypothetical protein LTS10_005752 [Elasticomyces elasticus]|nr:hypothetical protein LTS10_005752 [Elasticomyces elasticus]
MATTPPILRMPLELLQQTFEVVFSKHSQHGLRCEDMLSLRLVCREISAAVFDQFVATYLRQRTCCAADNDQLDKLVLYLDTQPLAREIRTVTLTLRTESSYHVEPDVDRLNGVAQRLAEQNCELRLDFGTQIPWRDFPKDSYWTCTVLKALVGNDCRIRSLSASERSLPDMLPDRCWTHKHLAALAELRTLRFDFDLYNDCFRYPNKQRSMAELVATTTDLEELNLIMCTNPGGYRNPGQYGFAGTVFLAINSRCLSKMPLRSVHVEPEALIQCLKRFQGTLRRLRFRQVSLITIPGDTLQPSAEAWTEVLGVMADIPLEDLLVEDCYLTSGYSTRRICVRPHPRWVEYVGEHRGGELALNEQSPRKIREQLSATLKRGLMLNERPW